MRRLALTLFVLMLLAAQAFAAVHTLRLSDGRVIRGELIRASEVALWVCGIRRSRAVRAFQEQTLVPALAAEADLVASGLAE